MKAMVLCAGFGTRLGALTRHTPKPLLPIAGHPLLGHLLSNLSRNGFSEAVINLHFEAEQIQNVIGHGSKFGLRVRYSLEAAPLGTAGGVKNAEAYFSQDEAFLVHYGDIVTNQDFAAMWRFHKSHGALATLLVHERKKSNSALVFDRQQRVVEFVERPEPEFWEGREGAWVNSGVAVFSKEIFSYIDASGASDLPRDVFPKLLPYGRVFAFPLTGHRIAVDSPERLRQAHDDMVNGVFSPLPRP